MKTFLILDGQKQIGTIKPKGEGWLIKSDRSFGSSIENDLKSAATYLQLERAAVSAVTSGYVVQKA